MPLSINTSTARYTRASGGGMATTTYGNDLAAVYDTERAVLYVWRALARAIICS